MGKQTLKSDKTMPQPLMEETESYSKELKKLKIINGKNFIRAIKKLNKR